MQPFPHLRSPIENPAPIAIILQQESGSFFAGDCHVAPNACKQMSRYLHNLRHQSPVYDISPCLCDPESASVQRLLRRANREPAAASEAFAP